MIEGIGDSRIYYEGCASSPLILGQWRGQNQGCRGAGVAHHWIWVSFLENKLPLCQSSSRIEGGLSTAGLFFPELGLETQPFEDVGHCQPNFREQLIDQAGDKKRDPLVHRADLDVTLRIVAQGGLPALPGDSTVKQTPQKWLDHKQVRGRHLARLRRNVKLWRVTAWLAGGNWISPIGVCT